MNFERLRYLAAVARTGTVRGAAASLQVTPGAVSKGLARLEEECGVRLLAPDGRGVRLTDDGQWLASRAEHLVGEFASLSSDLASRRTRDPGVCLATHDVFATWFAGQLADRFLPGVPLSVRERWPGEVEEAVATGLSDVGITFMPVSTEGVEHVEAARASLGVYVRRGAFPRVPIAELPFVVPTHPVSGAVGQYGPLDGWPADAPLRDVRFRASSLEARLELARHGLAAIVLPRFVAEMHDRRARPGTLLQAVELPPALANLSRRIHVVRRVGCRGQLARRADAVLEAVTTVCAG